MQISFPMVLLILTEERGNFEEQIILSTPKCQLIAIYLSLVRKEQSLGTKPKTWCENQKESGMNVGSQVPRNN